MVDTIPLRQLEAHSPTGFDVVPESRTNDRARAGGLKALECARRRFKRQRAVTHGLAGSIFGYPRTPPGRHGGIRLF